MRHQATALMTADTKTILVDLAAVHKISQGTILTAGLLLLCGHSHDVQRMWIEAAKKVFENEGVA